MPANAPIVINDGATTPVAHTFAPARTTADQAQYEDRAAGVYIGYNKLAFNLERPQGASRSADRSLKLRIRVETPKLEVVGNSSTGITPPPTVAYRPWAEVIYHFPERCSLQDRKDLQAYMKNAHSNAFVTSAVENFELGY